MNHAGQKRHIVHQREKRTAGVRLPQIDDAVWQETRGSKSRPKLSYVPTTTFVLPATAAANRRLCRRVNETR